SNAAKDESSTGTDRKAAGKDRRGKEGGCKETDRRGAAKDGRRREVDVRPRRKGARHVHFGQSGSAQSTGHRSLEELETRQWPQRLDVARRLEATHRQGGIHANAQLLRNQVGNGAPQRCDDQREFCSAPQCGAKEETMSLTELLGHVGLFGGAVMVCL